MTELILAVSLAVIISAGCSMFEAVLYSVPLRHIESMIRAHKKSGLIFKRLRKNVERPIAAILSLNTLANTAGAAIAGAAAARVFGHDSLVHFSLFFTLTILIFSEVLPKTAGVVYSVALAPLVAYPLRWLVIVMTPVIWVTGHLTGLISRNRPADAVSPEELKIMAQISLRTGGIERYQEMVIGNILTLGEKAARDVMTPRTVIFSLSKDLRLEEACKKTIQWEHSRIPVYDKDPEDIVGIVLTRELFMNLAAGKKDLTLDQMMRPVRFVAENARLNKMLMDFTGSREKLFVVIDEYGGLSGVISMEDILEEILGREILDESDRVADKRRLAKQKRAGMFHGNEKTG